MTRLHIANNAGVSGSYPCRCDNCGERLTSDELEWIRDAELRLTPGEETPAGECPHCFGLVFIDREEPCTLN